MALQQPAIHGLRGQMPLFAENSYTLHTQSLTSASPLQSSTSLSTIGKINTPASTIIAIDYARQAAPHKLPSSVGLHWGLEHHVYSAWSSLISSCVGAYSYVISSILSHIHPSSTKIVAGEHLVVSSTRIFSNGTRARNYESSNPKDIEDLRHIPDYVLEYAPYCHLYSDEEYWPGLLTDHLDHTIPESDYTPVEKEYQNPNLHDLDHLNQLSRIYLTSKDDPETYPDWLGGEDNVPESMQTASIRFKNLPLSSIPTLSRFRSSAPVTLVVVDKGEFVDAFWFFFYSFNLGNQVLGVRFGNHVGDWEHTAVRFKNGKPIEVFYSEHEWGAAYNWEDAEKSEWDSKRMLTYSAYGTHAMYRTAGVQRYVLPFGLLQDTTDKGPIWDPTLNMYAYTYDPQNDIVRASNRTPNAPEEWFHFRGKWGDKYYPMDDPRQYRFLGELHYSSGPTGPKFKNLGRSHICQNEDSCVIKTIAEDKHPRLITAKEWDNWRPKRRNED